MKYSMDASPLRRGRSWRYTLFDRRGSNFVRVRRTVLRNAVAFGIDRPPRRKEYMQPLIQQFQDELGKTIDKYRDQGLTLGESIGAIELVKLDLWREQTEDAAADELL